MSSKMTKDEIKKALKCCADWNGCNNYPYYYAQGKEDCVEGQILRDALALITEQEEKIEQLTRSGTHKTI